MTVACEKKWRDVMLPGNFALCDYGPRFSRVVGGMVSVLVGFSMLHGYRGIVPRLRASKINSDWAFHGCWLNTGGLGRFRFYPAIAFPCLFFFLCLLCSFAYCFFCFCVEIHVQMPSK